MVRATIGGVPMSTLVHLRAINPERVAFFIMHLGGCALTALAFIALGVMEAPWPIWLLGAAMAWRLIENYTEIDQNSPASIEITLELPPEAEMSEIRKAVEAEVRERLL